MCFIYFLQCLNYGRRDTFTYICFKFAIIWISTIAWQTAVRFKSCNTIELPPVITEIRQRLATLYVDSSTDRLLIASSHMLTQSLYIFISSSQFASFSLTKLKLAALIIFRRSLECIKASYKVLHLPVR